MRRRPAGLICAIAALLLAVGCGKPAVAEGPALWHLRDGDSEIWLFGTVHLLPPKLKWKSSKIENAFAAADTVYFETPTDSAAAGDIAALVRNYGVNPPGVTLSSLLTEDDRLKLNAVCKRVGVDPAAMETERPWLAALQVSVAYALKKGQASDAGVEHVLDTEARTMGKPRAYFETGEEQIRFFADLAAPVELAFLRSTMREIQDEEENVDEMDEAWAKGDVKRLGAYLDGMIKDTGPEVYAALIRQRNKRWVDKIDAMMHGHGKVFIAVGAAHLIGKDSVTALLREKGYKVEGP